MQLTHFISVDWGTTNLRIRLVEVDGLQIIGEVNNGKGVKAIHQLWQQHGGDKEQYFLQYLSSEINELDTHYDAQTMVVISGMASSTIGLRNLAYAQLPFNIDGSNVVTEMWQPDGFPHKVLLVSGVQSDTDVLRGEEVQLMGMQQPGSEAKTTLYILPGTHSKHMYCKNGRMYHFKTFMTGELFDTIANHTILRESIAKPVERKTDWIAFEAGIQTARCGSSVLNSLFEIRTNTLFKKRSATENYYYLSGLLVGSELSAINAGEIDSIVLCAATPMVDLYTRAMQVTGLSELVKPTDSASVNQSVVKGQWLILNGALNN